MCLMSEVELRWYMDKDDTDGQFIGNLDYWNVFNIERALWDRLKTVRRQLEYHKNETDRHDREARGIEVLEDARDSLSSVYILFREAKVRMAKEFHEKTSTVNRDEQDS